ncbi:hypothetical protein [Bacillus sp. CGMCC 1.16541]|uniref:hypothetical protein n=1 Tax=Bacillus sp. CGMCC 1.16541 TaxID=2185143 RepID=UPI000D72F67A|nr:hypothetical protein [Bacillus sp. CGMCC 1.16541]
MNKEKWNEKQIEELLSQMPTIRDERTPTQIYQQTEQKMSKPQKKLWLVPSIASIAAVFIIVVVSMSFVQQQNVYHQSSERPLNELQRKDEATPYEKKSEDKEDQPQLFESKEVNPSLAVQPSLQNRNEKFITIGIPDPQAQIVVPLTYIIDKKEPITVEDIKSISETVNEEQLGLSENMLEKVQLVESKEGVKVSVPEGFTANLGGTGEVVFQQSLEETFRWLPFEKVELYSGDTKGVEFGHLGKYVEISPNPAKQKGYMTYQPSESHPTYLVPTPQPFETINAALEVMKKDNDTYFLKASIPEDINIPKVTIENETVIYEFDASVNEKEIESLRYMLYALMFTAKDFGYKAVRFKGFANPQIGELKVDELQETPVAPNVVEP